MDANKIITKTTKTGATFYYTLDESGKKVRISKAEAEKIMVAAKKVAAKKAEAKNRKKADENVEQPGAKMRNSRWTRIHKSGETMERKDNVMDITVDGDTYKAEISYKTKLVYNFKKAAYWMLKSLETAKAGKIIEEVAQEIEEKAGQTDDMKEELFSVNGEGWSASIVKTEKGVFEASMNWEFSAE